jgi:hypothetical protein
VTDEPVSGAGADQAQPDQGIPIELLNSALDGTFKALFHTVARIRKAPHWQLQPFESLALVQGWAPIAQILLARLGSSEQVLLTLAMMSTAAVVGGKIAQEATLKASSTANTRTPKSADSSASSGSEEAARQPEPSTSFEEGDE